MNIISANIQVWDLVVIEQIPSSQFNLAKTISMVFWSKKILYAFMKQHRTVLLVPMLPKLEYISAFLVAPTNSSFCSLIRDSPAGMLRAEWWQVSEWLPPWGPTAREGGGGLLNATQLKHNPLLSPYFGPDAFICDLFTKKRGLLNAQPRIFR